MEQAPAIEMPPQRSLGDKLRHLGRFAAAAVGATLAMSAAEAAVSPDIAIATPAPITQAVDPNILPPVSPVLPPTTIPTTVSSQLKVGIATDGYNNDGLGYHTLFRDEAAMGATETRLPWTGNLSEMRDQVSLAQLYGINVILNISVTIAPEQAALIAAQLPSVDEIVFGNEPNDPDFAAGLTIEQYVAKLAQACAAIHTVRPDMKIWAFGMASGFAPLATFDEASQYADRKFGNGLPGSGLQRIGIYGIDFHLYRTLDKDKQLIDAWSQRYPGPKRIGEAGFILQDSSHPDGESQVEQASDTLSLLMYVAQNFQIEEGPDWYRLVSQPGDPFDSATIARNGVKRASWYVNQAFLTNR